MNGTEKQVAWAQDIVNRWSERLHDIPGDMCDEKRRMLANADAFLETITDDAALIIAGRKYLDDFMFINDVQELGVDAWDEWKRGFTGRRHESLYQLKK